MTYDPYYVDEEEAKYGTWMIYWSNLKLLIKPWFLDCGKVWNTIINGSKLPYYILLRQTEVDAAAKRRKLF